MNDDDVENVDDETCSDEDKEGRERENERGRIRGNCLQTQTTR